MLASGSSPPLVFKEVKAFPPIAILKSPTVTASKAYVPIAIFPIPSVTLAPAL